MGTAFVDIFKTISVDSLYIYKTGSSSTDCLIHRNIELIRV